jgi:hypothetical protein
VLKELALRIPPLRRLYDDRADLRTRLKAAQTRSPFWHYTSTFNAVRLMKRFAVADLEPSAGYLTNFLGVRIDPKFFPDILQGRAGEVEPIPIPANWHADIAEWGAALRSVDLSTETFTMIELGCGWGCWMNNTGLAARSVGRAVHLIGVEGDEGHLGFARESLATNGFTPEMFTLHHGIAAAEEGIALFPRQETSGVAWGLEPVFGATQDERDAAVAAGSHDLLPMVPLSTLAAPHPRIDLLHIDIQGGEANLVEGCLPLLQEKFAYLLIGTHSKQIEGRLYDMLIAAGWRLEMERAAIFEIVDGVPYVSVDGVQGWRNTALLPA